MVTGMTLHAEEGLGHLEQGLVRRAMGVMAVDAVLCNIGVFVNEGALVFHVAAGAGVLDAVTDQGFVLSRPMGVVAVGTDHFVLVDRMVGELGELHPDLLVTGLAELFLFVTTHLLLRSLVQLVAVKTAHVTVGMGAGCPVVQVGG